MSKAYGGSSPPFLFYNDKVFYFGEEICGGKEKKNPRKTDKS
jgi:hypothetical protein